MAKNKKPQCSGKIQNGGTSAAEGKAGKSDHQRKDIVTLDRRTSGDRRSGVDRRQRNEPVAVERRVLQRRAKVNRRRQIDPTTCERDYTAEEIEFMNALDQYKRASGRMFPTCSEILEVLRSLGYEKRPPQQAHTSQVGSPGSSSGAAETAPPASDVSTASRQECD